MRRLPATRIGGGCAVRPQLLSDGIQLAGFRLRDVQRRPPPLIMLASVAVNCSNLPDAAPQAPRRTWVDDRRPDVQLRVVIHRRIPKRPTVVQPKSIPTHPREIESGSFI